MPALQWRQRNPLVRLMRRRDPGTIAARIEAFLAKIYIDDSARAQFLADPRGEAIRAGLNDLEAEQLTNIDRVGLELTAESLRRKRSGVSDRSRRQLKQ